MPTDFGTIQEGELKLFRAAFSSHFSSPLSIPPWTICNVGIYAPHATTQAHLPSYLLLQNCIVVGLARRVGARATPERLYPKERILIEWPLRPNDGLWSIPASISMYRFGSVESLF